MLREAVHRTPALTARLNAAAAALRDDREPLPGRVSWLDYRLYLVRLYGFHAAIEPALIAFRPLSSVISDTALRNHKAALIAHDLVALGVDRRQLAQLPRVAVGPRRALPEALGWTYVVERETLGGKLLARRLARYLPDEVQRASAYLGCYGDEAAARWRELGEALDAYALAQPPAQLAGMARPGLATQATGSAAPPVDPVPPERACERVIDAVRDGLVQLRRWLGPVLQLRSTQRHA